MILKDPSKYLYCSYCSFVASKVLNPIMLADDRNLFFSHSDINTLFEKINKELAKPSNWFNANSINLNINGFTVERESSIKFLRVWIDKNRTWKDHTHIVKNETAKNIVLLCKANLLSLHTCLSKLCKHSLG